MNRLTCPSCHAQLRVQTEGEPSTQLTCPRCLAPITVPAAGTAIEAGPPAGDASAATAIQEGQPAPSTRTDGTNTRCPSCHSPVGSDWDFCPACGAVLERQPQRRRRPLADEEVSRSKFVSTPGYILLAILGTFGLAYFFIMSLQQALHFGSYALLINFLCVVGMLTFLSLSTMIMRTRGNPESCGVGRVVAGIVVWAGVLIGVFVTFIVTLFVVLFVVCLANGSRF